MNEPKENIKQFRQQLIDFIFQKDISKPVKFLIDTLPQQACLIIMGGALRNFFIKQFYGDAPATRDIDMVIGNLGKGFLLEKILTGEKFKNTDFGGLRWYPNDSAFSFDLSLLDNFLPIKKFHLNPDTTSLLASIDFNVNALIFDVKKNQSYETGAINAIKEKTIGFNAEKTFDRGLLAYRLLLIRHKIGFFLSREGFRFLKTALDLDMILWIKNTLESKTGKKLCGSILADYDRICLYKNYEEYKRQEKLPEYLKKIRNTGDQQP
jgi:hypothetical protein